MNGTKTITTVEIIVRHPWPVRLWHWTNALAVTLSLVTGLLIFNIHPSLYWCEDGHAGMPSILSLSVSDPDPKRPRFELRVGGHRWDVTGLMGVIDNEGSDQYVLVAAPPADFQFGGTRIWHFMSAWILVTAWLVYGLYVVLSGRLARVLWPTREDRTWRNLAYELRQHLLLKRARGEAAKRYNLLQKISYLIVVLVLMPALILSGLTMSNSVTAVFPDLFSLFGGRQSARSIHFITAALLLGFVVVHLLQVLVAGFFNSTRSMLTGRYAIESEKYE
jgi:thiosulfate reductase cytochrome b subunit